MDDEVFPDQFSAQSHEALLRSVDALTAALRAHADQLGAMRGGSSDVPAVFEANAAVADLVDAWSERVFDHTGTFPVVLAGRDDDTDELDDDVPQPADGDPVTVTSRWDLQVVDVAELLQAGRDAHRRLRPAEDAEDAAVAVPHPGLALYALLHERGEPWYDLPGVAVVRGERSYVRPDEPPTPLSDDTDDDGPVTEPAGVRLFGESWA